MDMRKRLFSRWVRDVVVGATLVLAAVAGGSAVARAQVLPCGTDTCEEEPVGDQTGPKPLKWKCDADKRCATTPTGAGSCNSGYNCGAYGCTAYCSTS